ncbi:hypothetical protein C8R42DRAFT_647305 [Lentinula raphanica]|nr:hypothetical protein C8R42DRAFT_647305 [Lentinula raphanica]
MGPESQGNYPKGQLRSGTLRQFLPLPYRCRRFSLRQTLQAENRARMKREESGDFLDEEVELEEEVEVVAQEKELSTEASGIPTSLGKPAPVGTSFGHNKTSNPRVKNAHQKARRRAEAQAREAQGGIKPVGVLRAQEAAVLPVTDFQMASLPVSTTAAEAVTFMHNKWATA